MARLLHSSFWDSSTSYGWHSSKELLGVCQVQEGRLVCNSYTLCLVPSLQHFPPFPHLCTGRLGQWLVFVPLLVAHGFPPAAAPLTDVAEELLMWQGCLTQAFPWHTTGVKVYISHCMRALDFSQSILKVPFQAQTTESQCQ